MVVNETSLPFCIWNLHPIGALKMHLIAWVRDMGMVLGVFFELKPQLSKI